MTKEKIQSILDVNVPSGKNYDKAEFRLLIPENTDKVQGLIVLVHGSNLDARPWIDNPFWQKIAERHNFGLLGCYFTDHLHEDMGIEEYARASEGSGQALIDAINELSKLSRHPEIAEAPMVLWGISAGGEFNYEFACWKSERVIAFIVNKGGIYYTALAPRATRKVPALLFIGEKDAQFRNDIIKGIFAINRKFGALWALTEEPGAVHELGRTLEMSEIFFDEVIPRRLRDLKEPLRLLSEKEGFIGDLKEVNYRPFNELLIKDQLTAWLPTERTAKAWISVVTGTKF
jgi:hypothetical protein